jgi:hypothetical protein
MSRLAALQITHNSEAVSPTGRRITCAGPSFGMAPHAALQPHSMISKTVRSRVTAAWLEALHMAITPATRAVHLAALP